VLKDILRRYPLEYEFVVPLIMKHVENIEDSEAVASIIWIIGEFLHKIDDPYTTMQIYVDGLKDSTVEIQQQVLTAAMKIFLKKTKDATAKKMLKTVLDIATKEIENPDVRDRGFIYLRLLTSAPEAAKQVVLSARPHVIDNNQVIDTNTLRELIANMSSLSSIYHKPPNVFVPQMRALQKAQTILPSTEQSQQQNIPVPLQNVPLQNVPVQQVPQNIPLQNVPIQNVPVQQEGGGSRTINLLGF